MSNAKVDAKKLFRAVLKTFNDDSKWDGATFGKIKTISNTKVGSVGQAFIERLCEELSLSCLFPVNAKGKRRAQNPWDVKIDGIEFELKTATEDTTNHFQFNHIRYHRKYQAVLCLGVSPENLYFGVWSKAQITTGGAGNLVTMEQGANASYKLTKAPDDLHPISSFKSEMKKFSRKFKKKS